MALSKELYGNEQRHFFAKYSNSSINDSNADRLNVSRTIICTSIQNGSLSGGRTDLQCTQSELKSGRKFAQSKPVSDYRRNEEFIMKNETMTKKVFCAER